MVKLSGETFARPENLQDRKDPKVLYVRSYLLIRTIVGVLGIVLPLLFIIGEAFFLRGTVQVRGSLSAYYHTSMRDLFVAGLCVIGFLLATYMSAQTDTWDFWLSLVAGVAVLGVAFFPTGRPGIADGAPLCGDPSMPAGCAAIQQQWGETVVAGIHYACAAVFIISLGVLAFYFASRERRHRNNKQLADVLAACGVVIFASVAWVAIGGLLDATFWGFTPLYVGEVLSVWAFGLAWLLKGRDLWKLLVPAQRRAQASRSTAPA